MTSARALLTASQRNVLILCCGRGAPHPALTQRSAAGAARLLVAMGGPALRWTPLSTAATGEPFGAVFEEPIAEIIASSALRDEMSVCPRLCPPAVNSVR